MGDALAHKEKEFPPLMWGKSLNRQISFRYLIQIDRKSDDGLGAHGGRTDAQSDASNALEIARRWGFLWTQAQRIEWET